MGGVASDFSSLDVGQHSRVIRERCAREMKKPTDRGSILTSLLPQAWKSQLKRVDRSVQSTTMNLPLPPM